MTKARLEELLINIFEDAIDSSEEKTKELVSHSGITSKELESIGYERDNFPEMHTWINEN